MRTQDPRPQIFWIDEGSSGGEGPHEVDEAPSFDHRGRGPLPFICSVWAGGRVGRQRGNLKAVFERRVFGPKDQPSHPKAVSKRRMQTRDGD